MIESENRDIIRQIIKMIHLYSERIAFVIEDNSYTYKQLGERICGILVELLLSPEKRVGIIAENTIETYAAVLAVLISGKTYVILHPSYPKERNLKIAQMAELQLILGTNHSSSKMFEGRSFNYMSINDLKLRSFDGFRHSGITEESAYIIFTSGSTGEPKGVPISRENLNSFYCAYEKLDWKLDENDRFLQMFELTFDVSIVSFLYPLTLGASIHTVGNKEVKHFKVFEILEQHALTFAAITPSLLQLLSPYFVEIYLPALKYLIVTAEASPVELINKFRFSAPNAEFINLYGPTEATIYCSSYKIPKDGLCKHYNGMIAIGRPFAGMEVMIADENDRRLPPGSKGELWLCGEQIMTGYLNDIERSEQVLVQYCNGRTYYKTGDICILDEDGDLIYCGRKDHQVKIQGFRIELSEIEYVTKSYFENSRNVVVIPISNLGIGEELCLILEGDECNRQLVFSYLENKLPPYMVPKQIYFINKFPMTASNKTDRKKIAELINNLK